MTKTLVAVLDGKSRLIGTKWKVRPAKGDFLLPNGCDLPMDGSYKLIGKAFVPLGHGFEKPSPPPYGTDTVLFVMIRAALDLTPDAVPHEAREWADWFEGNLKVREDELDEARDKRRVRNTA